MATIEIFARDVKGFRIFGAQHLFIIFTMDNGNKFIIRGGPEKGHEFYDNLHIINSPYKEQYRHLFPNDFIEGNPSTQIFPKKGMQATDEQIQAYMDKMIEVANLINAQKYDYKMPFGEGVQNSNTVINILVNAAELTFSLPQVNGKDVWAPGVYGNLEHTDIDQIIKFLLSPYGILNIAIGMQILLDAQNRGYIISMQNLDFINYAQGRFQDLASPSMKASNSPSISPNKGPTGNSPSPNKGGSSAGPSSNPTRGPTSGSSGSAANGNSAPMVRPSSANPTVSPAKAPITSPTVRAQTGPNNQPSKASTSGASRNANTPTTSQRASTNNPSVSPAKAPMNAPSSGPIRASSTSTNSNNAPTIKTNPSGVPTSSRAPSANVPAPVIIPMPSPSVSPSVAPTRVPGQNYNYQRSPIKTNSQPINFGGSPTSSSMPIRSSPSLSPIFRNPTLSSQPSSSVPGFASSFTPSFNSQPNFPLNRPSSPFSSNVPSFSPTLNSQQWNRPSSPKQNSQPQHPWTIPISPTSSPLYPPSSTGQRAPISMPIISSGRVPRFAPSFSNTGSWASSNDNVYRSRPFRTNGARFTDPTWIYSRSSPNDYAAYRSFNDARANFANSFDPRNRESFNFNNFNSFQTPGSGANGASRANAMARASFSAAWAGAIRGALRYAASHVSPLVLDLNCNGVELLSFNDGVYFDIDNDGFVEKIGWVKSDDGQLVRDLNHNGRIDDITELFGNDITSAFYKLGMLDSNKDKIIDENDKAYEELLVWQDLNKNGYSEPEELKKLRELGIISISLQTKEETQEIEGNLTSESSNFSYEDGRVCKVLDVHFHNNDMDSWYKGASKLEGSEAREKIKEELKKYIQYIYAQLREHYNSVFKTDNIEFRLSEIIRFKTESYINDVIIEKIQKIRKDKIDEDFKDGEETLKNLFKVSHERFYETITNLAYKINKDNFDKQQKAKDAATKKLQEELVAKKEDITSRYMQKLNYEIEELNKKQLSEEEFKQARDLLEKKLKNEENKEVSKLQKRFDLRYDEINKSTYYLNEINSEKIKALKEDFATKKAKILSSKEIDIDQEMEKAKEELLKSVKHEKANLRRKLANQKITKAEYDKRKERAEKKLELGINKEKIEAKAKLGAKEEIAKLQELHRIEYINAQNLVKEEVGKELKDKYVEEGHFVIQLATEGMKALNIFYFKQKAKAEIDLQNYIDYLKESIKEEANQLYDHILSESQSIKTDEAEEEMVCEREESSSWSLADFYNYLFDQKKEERNKQNNNWLNPNLYLENNKFQVKEEGIVIDPETLLMPLMRGYGTIASLHIAMSINPTLKAEVMDLIYVKAIDLYDIQRKITNILYQWAGVEKIEDNSRSGIDSPNIEARKIEFIEKITGQPFKQLGAAKFVGQHASTSMQKAWDISLIRATKNLLIQGPLMPIFPKAVYSFEYDSITLNSPLDEILTKAQKFANDHKLGYDFWVQIGYILAASAVELNTPIAILKSRLSELAGESILVGLDPFSLIGDNQNNDIKGTSGSDYIKGLDGDDKLDGKDGSDFIEGGDGDDEIYGGDGIDRLYGNKGKDKIHGGKDKDFIYGGEDADSIYGDEGDDHIEGGEGADFMDGGSGKNTLSYGKSPGGVRVDLATGEASGFDAEGDKFQNFIHLGGSEYNDVLIGDDKDNEINGEGGDDEIHGGKGNDQLFGATGKDHLYGEDGDDTLIGFEGPDHMDGGAGTDTVDYHHPYSTVGVNVDLSSGKGIGGYAHGDTYVNIENVIGSKFDDKITGDDKANILEGMEGDDEIHGGDGNDTIIDQQGFNNLYGDNGNDKVVSYIGNFCFGGEGEDTISYENLAQAVKIDMPNGSTTLLDEGSSKDTFTEFENAIGTNADDIIIGDEKDNKLFGLKGNDIIRGGDGDDEIHPGDGDDKIYGDKGNDHLMGSLGADFYDGGEGIDTVDYSQEPDKALYLNLKLKKMTGATFAQGDILKNIERIIGTKFNDVMIGDDTDNHLYGYDGDDAIYGGEGDDVLCGGEGKNKLYGEDGNDVFIIGKGENLVYGGAGTNKVNYQDAIAGVEINLSTKQGKKSSGELDVFEDIHDCIGSKHADKIIGNSEMNHLYGLDGDDYIDGGGGADTIDGGKGNNILFGGPGNDKFILLEGSNQVDGGSNIDTAIYTSYKKEEYEAAEAIEREIKIYNIFLPSYSGEQFTKPIFPQGKGIVVDLTTGIVEKPNGLNDKLTNVENIDGTYYDDIITGDDQDNTLNGYAGSDIIHGGNGNDEIIAGRGHSELHGDEGDDLFKVSQSSADIYGGEGNDAVEFKLQPYAVKVNLEQGTISYKDRSDCKFESIEEVQTTEFDDVVYDSKGDNFIKTSGGNDTIYISDGNDSVDAGDGDDVIYISGSGEKRLIGGTGSDRYVIMPKCSSTNKTGIIIGDFTNNDKIDLSNLANMISFSDLELKQIEQNGTIVTVIKIHEYQDIELLGVPLGKISSENFVFNA